MNKLHLKRRQIHVIAAVTFGNVLEWFEVYLFAYLAPVLSQVFFGYNGTLSNLEFAFIVFGLGFVTRPLGGILFGRVGDLLGRKKAFFWSIVILTVPTFLMGALPTYQEWGIWAPIAFCILRLLQSIPTGGEIPGTICYLYENSDPTNRRFMTSWNAVGNQIGALVGLVEMYLMSNYTSAEFMLSWGWRISFLTGGLIGLLGIYLRHTLHETPVFEKLKVEHKIDKESLFALINKYKYKIGIGTAFGAIDAASFYLIATYIPTFFDEKIGLSENQNMFVSFLILVITTVLLPFFGRLGDKVSNKFLCSASAVCLIALLYPLVIAIECENLVAVGVIGAVSLIPISCITALIAYLLGNLFPAPVRFTGVGLAVNLADGIIGGFTPAIALFLMQVTRSPVGFSWYILACGLVSLFAYLFFLKRHASPQ